MFCKHCGKEIKEGVKFCKYCGGSLTISPETVKASTEIVYGGFWIRSGAFVIDYALILIAAFILGYLFPFLFVSLSFLKDELLGFIMIIIYHVFFLAIFSSTPGKMLYKLRVIDEKTEAKISFGKALARSLSYVISSILIGLGFLVIGFDKPKHRGWHDRIAKTLVVRKENRSLVLPIILSVIALSFSIYVIYFLQKGYDFSDFSYLGGEVAVINSIQQRISQQSPGFCCSYLPSYEIDYYLKDIPLELLSKGEKNAEQIFEDFSEAIVTIGGETEYGEFFFGSGFIISPSGLIVTNYHVVEDMDKLVVALIREEIQLFDVSLIVAEDFIKDIAVLKIDGQNLPYVIMGNSDVVKSGQEVFAIGNPEGFTSTISEGIISQIREFEEGIKSFQITTPISMGSSGGALFNEMGEVIGIANMIFWSGQNINFAIPINYVKELIGLKKDISETISEDSSNLFFCHGEYWLPCPVGEKPHCPKIGDPFCCSGVICNDECWELCLPGEEFYCPLQGEPHCY